MILHRKPGNAVGSTSFFHRQPEYHLQVVLPYPIELHSNLTWTRQPFKAQLKMDTWRRGGDNFLHMLYTMDTLNPTWILPSVRNTKLATCYETIPMPWNNKVVPNYTNPLNRGTNKQVAPVFLTEQLILSDPQNIWSSVWFRGRGIEFTKAHTVDMKELPGGGVARLP